MKIRNLYYAILFLTAWSVGFALDANQMLIGNLPDLMLICILILPALAWTLGPRNLAISISRDLCCPLMISFLFLTILRSYRLQFDISPFYAHQVTSIFLGSATLGALLFLLGCIAGKKLNRDGSNDPVTFD